jgi:hypothetical protein
MSTSTQRMQRMRERQKLADLDAGTVWEGLVDEERERTIKSHHGFARPEDRSQAERQATADRIVASFPIWAKAAAKGLFDLRPKSGDPK